MLVLPTEGQSGTLDIPLPEFFLDKLESEEMVKMHMPTFPVNLDSVRLLHTLPVPELEVKHWKFLVHVYSKQIHVWFASNVKF